MTIAEDSPTQAAGNGASVADAQSRLIDHWFPCGAVDAAVGTPAGSGRSEKALFTWFASRPIAQARAAILTTLLPDREELRADVRAAVERGSRPALDRLRDAVAGQYPDGRPVVLDIFSGRGIIPLEAARLGVVAVGTDLSPVATLGARLLADFPLRDWSSEPSVPFKEASAAAADGLFEQEEPRLLSDVRSVIAEVGKRVAGAVMAHYPFPANGTFPWAYLWAITVTSGSRCKWRARFPLA